MEIIHNIIPHAYAISTIANPGFISFNTIVENTIKVLLLIAAILATIFLVYSGIQYITASGEPAKATAARTGIVNAIIGIIVIILAFSITTWVSKAVIKGDPGSGGASTGTVTVPGNGTSSGNGNPGQPPGTI